MCSRPPLCLLHAYSSRLLVQSCSSLPSTRYFLSIQDLVPLKCSDTLHTARTSLHSPPDVAATTQTAPKPCYQHRTSHQAQPNSKTKASQTHSLPRSRGHQTALLKQFCCIIQKSKELKKCCSEEVPTGRGLQAGPAPEITGPYFLHKPKQAQQSADRSDNHTTDSSQ